MQVKTEFGKYKIEYDPVSGAALDNTTEGYDMPPGAGGGEGGDGLSDISLEPAGHATVGEGTRGEEETELKKTGEEKVKEKEELGRNEAGE
jgi:hypothetical protein